MHTLERIQILLFTWSCLSRRDGRLVGAVLLDTRREDARHTRRSSPATPPFTFARTLSIGHEIWFTCTFRRRPKMKSFHVQPARCNVLLRCCCRSYNAGLSLSRQSRKPVARTVASGRDTTRMCGLFVANHRHRVQLAVVVFIEEDNLQ